MTEIRNNSDLRETGGKQVSKYGKINSARF